MKTQFPTYKITAFLLALLVFLTSGGLILSKHNCQMQQKKLAEGEFYSCADSGCKKGCCSTEFLFFKLDQDQINTPFDVSFDQEVIQFATVFVSTFLRNIIAENSFPKYQFYKPPLIQKDIPVLIQSFLL